jgi:general secretion pathway protein G
MLTGRKLAAIIKFDDSRAAGTLKNRRDDARSNRHSSLGFTMLELMVVIAIIMILLGLAAGKYQRSLLRAKEGVLHQDLRVMREAIQQYTLDKGAAPQSLDELVDHKDGNGGYLMVIPVDPITQQRDWKTETEDILLSPEQTTVGISDVHSASNEISPFEGTPYSQW